MAKYPPIRWTRLTLFMSRPEYDLIARAAKLTGVSMGKFLVDAALAVAIPLCAALPRKARKPRPRA